MDSIPSLDDTPEARGESCPPPHVVVPLPDVPDCGRSSRVGLSFSGGGLTVWSDPGTTEVGETSTEVKLQLQPDRPVVIGRQEGGEIVYLDPRYRPTRLLPDTNVPVVRRDGSESDTWVSRGHFLLRATAEGIILLNGVPRREGGVRPPLNGTRLLQPQRRKLEPGEEYLIASGMSATIQLPNGVQVIINAG